MENFFDLDVQITQLNTADVAMNTIETAEGSCAFVCE
ncbi:hypothetical protein EV586_104401 [Tumebacillus sp. BK434]|nr:hypothetical protein EV586_104401 [Tumebacillus sp. BK434]